jgi:hypothetical protein
MAIEGRKAKVNVSGAAVAFVGEATTMSLVNTKYQITDTSKQVLDRTATIRVHKYSADQSAEAGTNTTTLNLTGHGLNVGDLIINHTRSHAKRLVLTKPSNDQVTVAAITDQASGDTIEKCPTEASTGYTLNRLSGYVTYGSGAVRTIYISGSYLPLTEAAESNEFSMSIEADNQDNTKFGANYITREQALKDISGSLSGFYYDATYKNMLVSGDPVVVEFYSNRSSTFDMKAWLVLASDEISASVDGLVEESIEFEGATDSDGRCITFD